MYTVDYLVEPGRPHAGRADPRSATGRRLVDAARIACRPAWSGARDPGSARPGPGGRVCVCVDQVPRVCDQVTRITNTEPRAVVRATWCALPGARSVARWPRALDRGPRALDRGRPAARPGAWRDPHAPRAPKNGPGRWRRGPWPCFTRYVLRETLFDPRRKKGPLCQKTKCVSKFLQFQNETDPHDP